MAIARRIFRAKPGRRKRATPHIVLTPSCSTRTTPSPPHSVTSNESTSTQRLALNSETLRSTSACVDPASANGTFDQSASRIRCSASGRSFNSHVDAVTNTMTAG